MDELVKEIVKKTGLDEQHAKAAAEVAVNWFKKEQNRKKVASLVGPTSVATRI